MPHNRSTRWITAIAAFALVSGGCAISDYRGYLNHATSDNRGAGNGYRITQFDPGGRQNGLVGEAKLFGKEIASSTSDPAVAGTYSYTVEYDFRGRTTPIPIGTSFPSPIIITTYRNRVVGAFNADGNVDRDGDDIRGNAGSTGGRHDPADPAGIWERQFLYVDRAPGCQFAANFEQAFTFDKPSNAPQPSVLLCSNSPLEEIDDRDIALQCEPPQDDPNPATPACKAFSQDSFGNLGEVFQKIWGGAIGALASDDDGFTVEATSITINGNKVALSSAAVIDLQAN
ncbi:MAG: hypothetical protein M3365_08945, partial [Gemmatimonadota bacterium]|nr:hypothetical protein [Gemmatimonadota bacterium]